MKTSSNTFLLSMVISRNGRVLAATGQPARNEDSKSGTVYLWDARTFKSLPSLYPQKQEVGVSRALTLSPDGKYLGASRSNFRFSLYDVATRRLLWRQQYAKCAEFSPDGKSIALSGSSVQIVAASDGRLRKKLPTKGGSFISWSPDSKLLACEGPLIKRQREYQSPLTTGLFVELWDVRTGRRIRTIPSELTTNAHFSPDGKSLVAVGDVSQYKSEETWGARVRLFDVNTGRLKWAKGYKFCEAIFSPDGRVVAALQYPKIALDQTRNILLLDPRTGATRGTLSFRPHSLPLYGVSALAFSSDGKRLFARGDDSVHVWDLN